MTDVVASIKAPTLEEIKRLVAAASERPDDWKRSYASELLEACATLLSLLSVRSIPSQPVLVDQDRLRSVLHAALHDIGRGARRRNIVNACVNGLVGSRILLPTGHKAEEGWRDIASAPKDGTVVLVWWPYWNARYPIAAKWDASGQWYSHDAPSDGGEPPTHWRYMPTPPIPSESGEGSVECHGLDTPERVCFYEQDYYVLSNFSAFELHWKGWKFPTSEAAYHFEKFDDLTSSKTAVQTMILNATSAHEAFKIAERHKQLRRPDWDLVKVDIMRDILRAKAQQHEYVRRKLLATGDRELVENSWRDDFWGWGPRRDGQNMLGTLWMEIRAEIRAAD